MAAARDHRECRTLRGDQGAPPAQEDHGRQAVECSRMLLDEAGNQGRGTRCGGCRRLGGGEGVNSVSEGLDAEDGVAVTGLQADLPVERPDAGDTVI
jgi:hypothetical protein